MLDELGSKLIASFLTRLAVLSRALILLSHVRCLVEGLLRVGSVASVVVLLMQLLLSLLHVDHELLLILQVPDVSVLLRVRDVALYAT